MGDAISHAILPGVVLAYLLNLLDDQGVCGWHVLCSDDGVCG